MCEYLVLFRLPLQTGSELDRLLTRAGWLTMNDAVYYHKLPLSREQVVAQLKILCRCVGEISGRTGVSAFTVVQIDEKLRRSHQSRLSRTRTLAMSN